VSAPAPLKLLLTGHPGCGKTTAVREVVRRLEGRVSMSGFWTEEVREGGRRVGFDGVTLAGQRFALARLTGETPYVLGPYHVSVEGLERVGVAALEPRPGVGLLVLDEIGKMESFSTAFRERVEALLAGPTPLLATVALRGVGLVKKVRQDRRVQLVTMTPRSRGAIVEDLVRRLEGAHVVPPAQGGKHA